MRISRLGSLEISIFDCFRQFFVFRNVVKRSHVFRLVGLKLRRSSIRARSWCPEKYVHESCSTKIIQFLIERKLCENFQSHHILLLHLSDTDKRWE